jgi:hypothetical protein
MPTSPAPPSEDATDSDTSDMSPRVNFPASVKNSLHAQYGKRCAVCLQSLVIIECSHVIDASLAGASQVSLPEICSISHFFFFHSHQVLAAAEVGVISAEYDRGSQRNGMVCEYHMFMVPFRSTNIVYSVCELSCHPYPQSCCLFASIPTLRLYLEVYSDNAKHRPKTTARGMIPSHDSAFRLPSNFDI